MALFRKKETYNAQMLREAGLDRVVFNLPQPAPEPEEESPEPPSFGGHVSLGESPRLMVGGRGLRLPPAWDTTATTGASGIQGDSVKFIALPSGDLILTSEEGDGDLSPLADAIEEHLSPPYKAVASRQAGDLWGVGASRIEVATFQFADAELIELSERDGETELRVDGEPSDAAVPVELQRLGERTGGDFWVEASRIDGDEWEVKGSPL